MLPLFVRFSAICGIIMLALYTSSDIKDWLKRLDRAPDPDAALGIFLDLNLEYDSLRDFKSLCVLIPDEYVM